jgi:5-methylcytosine-specific restriction endonuclease McrA
MGDLTCVICARSLTGRQLRFCSAACSRRGAHLAQVASGYRVLHRSKPEIKAKFREYSARSRSRQDPDRLRAQWREYSRTRRPPRRAMSQRMNLARRKARRAARGTNGGKVQWANGPCRRCGEWFTGKRNGPVTPAFCSGRCSRADIRAQRRAQEAGVKITKGRRWAVHERDGWICRICGDPVNRDAAVPALDAPVIDHRIPLAAGGEHSEANWQTAHYYCNSVKRDQVGFDFAA